MLKKLSLSPDEARDDSPVDAQAENSETRMLRALEALSSAPQSRGVENPPQREPNPFRSNKQSQSREPFRNDTQHHGNKARHRFVKDGEIPVVHVPPARPRDQAQPGGVRNDPEFVRLQQLLDEQRLRADAAERARNELQAQVKTLQTKLAHSELTLADMQALAQSRLDEANTLRQELAQPRTAPPAPVSHATQPATGDAPIKRGRGRPRKIVTEAEALAKAALPKRGPGRPRKVVLEQLPLGPEPEPVEWWLLPPKPKRRG